jgi:pSer/pThr/pTyr-binding forkhead associated (FHA) protein
MPEEKVAKLVVRTRSGYRYEFPITGDSLTIGRGRDCHLVLDDKYASRHHARVQLSSGNHILIDEGSRNGTLVEGKRIARPHTLLDGEEIQIGRTGLTYAEESLEDSTTKPVESLTPEQLDSPIQVDTHTWEVWVEGKKLEGSLSILEFKLLAHLYRFAGKVCSRDELCCEIWGEAAYTYEMLHQLVHRVKQRVEPDPRKPRYLVSVPGVGYKLDTDITASPGLP